MTAAKYIDYYRLQPHPEGGWYREIYRSCGSLGRPAGCPGERVALMSTKQTGARYNE